ncbi:universal stress protein [Azospirillum halopraeferens]|uniref:universal stress protein n=1 Tax=Azospirillum halopraeferens TaxID=34010 RepID=UPI0003F597A9|nr:universal stress protein [Azospirillum halopraeferens]
MTLKNLLVHRDGGPRSAERLAVAVDLARRHGARLTGLFARCAAPRTVGIVTQWPSPAYAAAAAADRDAFAAATRGLPDAQWRDAYRGGTREVTHALIEAAHHVDLVILGQDGGDGTVPPDLVEQVLLHAGRPGLVLPCAGTVETIGRRPLIAWNHSRESARALNDALPLIAGCTRAVVLSVAVRPDEERAAARDCRRHLEAHGIAADVEVLVPEGVGVMDMMLNRAADLDADLLVLGAHGHIGFPFLYRGDGTRHILAHMTLPVLMSH